MTDFKREARYLVLKWKDAEMYLSSEETETLLALSSKLNRCRDADGRVPFNSVVVEQDWPEFEPTWAAIEARMSGMPSPLDILRALACRWYKADGSFEVLPAEEVIAKRKAAAVEITALRALANTLGEALKEGECRCDKHSVNYGRYGERCRRCTALAALDREGT